jgi:hypothetical protein
MAELSHVIDAILMGLALLLAAGWMCVDAAQLYRSRWQRRSPERGGSRRHLPQVRRKSA